MSTYCSHCQEDALIVKEVKAPSALKTGAERVFHLCRRCNKALEVFGALPLLPFEKPFRYSAEGRTPRCPTLEEYDAGIRAIPNGPIVVR